MTTSKLKSKYKNKIKGTQIFLIFSNKKKIQNSLTKAFINHRTKMFIVMILLKN